MATTVFPTDTAVTDGMITPTADANSTVVFNGEVRRGMYKVTVPYTSFQAAATTKDVTIATLAAKQKIVGIISDTTVAFTGEAGTGAIIVGVGAGGAEYIATHDVKSAAVTKGLADADMGSLLTRAAAINGGSIPSWTTTTTVVARFTSGTGNTSALVAGSVTFYIIVEQF